MIIADIWRGQPGKYFCLMTKGRGGGVQEHWLKRGEVERVAELAEKYQDRNVWTCPHGFSEKIRQKKYASGTTLLWADLDKVDPRKLEWKPTVAIESSPGRYVALWMCDEETSEELNKRMTYAVGADRGGWDLTQVLRCPGTRNWKYKEGPRARVLWRDGPVWKVSRLEREVPVLLVRDSHEGDSGAAEILKQYSGRLLPSTRRALVGKDEVARVGKRSDMLWKLENELVDAGLTYDESLILLRGSVWNKHSGREGQLERELTKIYKQRLNGAKVEVVKSDEVGWGIKQMSEVEREEHDWIWWPYLARQQVTMVEGDPGAGKSWLTQIVAKHACDGEMRKLPSPSPRRGHRGKLRVLAFDADNSSSTITRPRLEWADCKHMENYYQKEEPFSIEENYDQVVQNVKRIKADIVIFDIVHYFLAGDTHKADISTALKLFHRLATECNCVVILVRWMTKGKGKLAVSAGLGSAAFTGTTAVQIAVMKVGDEMAFAISKTRIGTMPPAHSFSIESAAKLGDPDRAITVFGDWIKDLNVDELVAGDSEKVKNRGAQRDAAKEFLISNLGDGERSGKDIEELAEKFSFSDMTLRRACRDVGVIKSMKTGISMWSIPEKSE